MEDRPQWVHLLKQLDQQEQNPRAESHSPLPEFRTRLHRQLREAQLFHHQKQYIAFSQTVLSQTRYSSTSS